MAGSTERPLGPEVSSTLDNGDSPTKTGGEKASRQKPPMVAISEEETESITSVSPPDGGWGWWVVFASFMIHIVGESTPIIENPIKPYFAISADGITYSFGIFLVALIDKFNADRGYASLIPSILVGITLGAGTYVHVGQESRPLTLVTQYVPIYIDGFFLHWNALTTA